MKLKKRFLGIFLGLNLFFAGSLSVSARINKEKLGQFESFAVRFALNIEKQKGVFSGRSILKNYIENHLNLKDRLTEGKFKKAKGEFLEFCVKCIREDSLLLKKQKDLLKKAETNSSDENFKDIIKFGLEEYEKDRSFLDKICKTESLIKDDKDPLKQGIDFAKKNLDYLENLNKKNKFSKEDKENLKFRLKLGIDESKSDIKESKKIKKEIECLEYEDFKDNFSKKTKNKKLENFIKNFSRKNKNKKDKMLKNMVLEYILEKNNLKAKSKINENMFEEAKKEFIEFYERCIKEKEMLAKEGEEALKKGDRAIISFIIKNNKEMIEDIKKKIMNEKLTEKELNIAKTQMNFRKTEIKDLENVKLDRKQKLELKENFNMFLEDIKESKKIKKEIEKLKYEEVKK